MRYPFVDGVEVYRNLMPNPSFEDNDAGWTAFAGSPTVERVGRPITHTELAGHYCLRIVTTEAGDSDVQGPEMEATAGLTYTATATMRDFEDSRDNALIFRFYDAAHDLIGGGHLGSYVMSSSDWTTISHTYEAPALTAYMRVLWRVHDAGIGEIHYLDTVSVIQTDEVLPYFDGNTQNDGLTYYRWLGADDNSASVAETPGAGDYLNPIMVFGPYVNEWEARTQSRSLLESTETRSVFIPPGARTGTFMMLFSTYAEASDAGVWFGSVGHYIFTGPEETGTGGYTIVDGYIVEIPATIDHSFDLDFVVTGGSIRLEQTEASVWQLTVPWREASS